MHRRSRCTGGKGAGGKYCIYEVKIQALKGHAGGKSRCTVHEIKKPWLIQEIKIQEVRVQEIKIQEVRVQEEKIQEVKVQEAKIP